MLQKPCIEHYHTFYRTQQGFKWETRSFKHWDLDGDNNDTILQPPAITLSTLNSFSNIQRARGRGVCIYMCVHVFFWEEEQQKVSSRGRLTRAVER